MVPAPGMCTWWHRDRRPMLARVPGTPYRVDTYIPVQPPRPVEVLADDGAWAPAMLYSWSRVGGTWHAMILWRSADLLRTYHTEVIYSPAALRTVPDEWWDEQQRQTAGPI
ncbi:hypothetical protein [Microbispora corallina]|nr:hypothetical protein [Microbispora corallina]